MKQKLESKLPSEKDVLDPKCDHPMRSRLCDYYSWKRNETSTRATYGTLGYAKLKEVFKKHFAWEREQPALETLRKSKELTFNQAIDKPVAIAGTRKQEERYLTRKRIQIKDATRALVLNWYAVIAWVTIMVQNVHWRKYTVASVEKRDTNGLAPHRSKNAQR